MARAGLGAAKGRFQIQRRRMKRSIIVARTSMTRVVVAMSGGVDSSAAAWMLQKEGFDVVGLFLRNGISHAAPKACATELPILTSSHKQGCCSLDDSRDAGSVAALLNIPFYAVDYASEFGSIIEYFVDAYQKGNTPNPCVVCNRDLKFGSLLQFAKSVGAQAVATGHYARLEKDTNGAARLRRAADRAKDQSYVLAAMDPASLQLAMFPLGEYTKPQVREIAREAGLPVFNKRESQEICFVPSNNYRDLLEERGIVGTPGDIVNERGDVLGAHDGFEHFTIGQRKGIGVAHTEALYVKSIDPASARVTVVTKNNLTTNWLECGRASWFVNDIPRGEHKEYLIQARAHQTPVPARVIATDRGARVEFTNPQAAIAPGQLAVFYDGEYVVGSGWVEGAG